MDRVAQILCGAVELLLHGGGPRRAAVDYSYTWRSDQIVRNPHGRYGVMTKPDFLAAAPGTRVTAHARHVGDRVNTMGFEGEALSAGSPFIRGGAGGGARPVGPRGAGLVG